MKRKIWILPGLLLVIFVGLLCMPAGADDGYDAPKLEKKTPWPAIGVTVICVFGLCLSGLKNSRRSHQTG